MGESSLKYDKDFAAQSCQKLQKWEHFNQGELQIDAICHAFPSLVIVLQCSFLSKLFVRLHLRFLFL